ncbi:hypothetical protein M422DRAFT_32517, partial [Sphaerobolus stellatus SS14]
PNETPYYELRKPADLWAIGLTLYDIIFGTAVCALFNYTRLSVILIHPHSHMREILTRKCTPNL